MMTKRRLLLALSLMFLFTTGCANKAARAKEEQEMQDAIGAIKKKRFNEDGVTCYYFVKWKESEKSEAGAGGLSCVRDPE